MLAPHSLLFFGLLKIPESSCCSRTHKWKEKWGGKNYLGSSKELNLMSCNGETTKRKTISGPYIKAAAGTSKEKYFNNLTL